MVENIPAKSKDKLVPGRAIDSTGMHSYVCKSESTCLIPLPKSEPSTQDSKRSWSEPTLGEVQDNIIKILLEKMSQNTDDLNQEIKQNQ